MDDRIDPKFSNLFDPKPCRFHIDNPECIVCSPYYVQNKGYGPLILYDFRVLKLQNKVVNSAIKSPRKLILGQKIFTQICHKRES